MKTLTFPLQNALRFGTNGWRGIISDSFTFTNVEIVAQAYADYVNNQQIKKAENSPNQAASSVITPPFNYNRL